MASRAAHRLVVAAGCQGGSSPFRTITSRRNVINRVVRRAGMRPLQQCQPHDLLECHTSSESGPSIQLMEVVDGWNGSSAVVQWKGQLLKLAAAAGEASGNVQLTALGGYPAADSLAITSFSGMSSILPAMHSHGGEAAFTIQSAEVTETLDHLISEVNADAAFWRDGMAPGDPIKTDLQQAIFTAGEIAALLLGQRGLVLVQMFNGWDPSKGQPLYNPFTLHMLERALSAPGVGFRSSVAPGGVGLTAVLYADREPYASWAEHLCSFGCQANIVAGSAYYKLLIGQLLGYKLENVLGYMAASGEPASAQLQQQVAQDIKQLSKVQAKLPWSPDDGNIRKPKKAKAASSASSSSPKGGFSSSKAASKSRTRASR